MTTAINPLAVMKDASYQAWANDGEPTEPIPEPLTFIDLIGRELSADQISLVIALITTGAEAHRLTNDANPDPLWNDAMDLAEDLHKAWSVAFERKTGRKQGEPR